MKIWVYTLCYNEMKILPWCVKYWKEYADKVIVYDNGSNDGSREYLQSFSFIEIRDQDEDLIDNDRYLRIKNNVWKEARDNNVDYVVVCDTDEVLYSETGVKNDLLKYYNEGITVVETNWCNIITMSYPDINCECFVHQVPEMYGIPHKKDKTLIFNPNKIEESNYKPGAHESNFKGDIKRNNNQTITVYHLNKMGLDYFLEKTHNRKSRLSKNNIRKGYSVHYRYSDERIKRDYMDAFNKAYEYANKNK